MLTIERSTQHLLMLCQDADIARSLETTLHHHDFQTTVVRNSGQAVLMVLNAPPIDAFILDGQICLASEGEKTLQQIRSNLEALGIPLLMLIDPDDDAQWTLAERLAADEFVLKPMAEAELLTRVKGLLWRRENGSRLGGSPQDSDLFQGFIRYVRNDLEIKTENRGAACLGLIEPAGVWELLRNGDQSGEPLTDQLFDFLASNIRRVDRVVRCGPVTLIAYLPGRRAHLTQQAMELLRREFAEQYGVPFCLGLAACPEDGTSFTDLVLAADQALTTARRQPGEDLSSASTHSPNHRTLARKVLVVDDDPFMVAPLKATLEALGFDTVTAATEQEALDLIHREDPDLLLLDEMTEQTHGFELLEQLRFMNPDQGSPPVILLLGRTASTDMISGFELGVDDYVGKPIHPGELITRVERVLASRPSFLRVGFLS